MNQLSVLIFDGDAAARAGLARRLNARPEFRVVAQTSSPASAVRSATIREPDILLLNLRRNDSAGRLMCQRLARASPGSHLVILTSYLQASDDELRTSIVGCTLLLKTAGLKGLIEALRTLCADRLKVES